MKVEMESKTRGKKMYENAEFERLPQGQTVIKREGKEIAMYPTADLVWIEQTE